MEITDQKIKLIKEDPRFFGIVYEKYFKEIYAYSYYLSGKKHDAEDLTANAFMRALEKLHTFDGDSKKIRSWLYTITRNIFIDIKRKEKNKHINIDAEIDMPDTADMELRVDTRIMIDRLIEYVNNLEPVIYAEVLLLRYKQDLTITEIAGIISKTEDNVRIILHRATSKLRKVVLENE